MAKQLDTDELLEILCEEGHPLAKHFIALIETATTAMADIIAEKYQLDVYPATFQGVDFAGTCAAFGPRTADQPVPQILSGYDENADWEPLDAGRMEEMRGWAERGHYFAR